MLYTKLCYESYAQRRGSNTFTLPLSEVKCALDISGFQSLESRRTFLWITAGHTDNIRRNTLDKILSFLHDNDSDNLPKYKKVGWVSKYLDELRSNVKTHWICERQLDMDRCMVEYFGWYGTFLRQSIKMKPKWFENKIWRANLPVRYFFDFNIYESSTGCRTDNVASFAVSGTLLFLISLMVYQLIKIVI